MFLITFLLSAALEGANSQTIPADPVPPSDTDKLGCSDRNERSVTGIVWSCMTVMVACTWLSVHPNIPSVRDTAVVVVRRKLGIMLLVLIAPELVIFWAVRQWLGARKIGQKYRNHGWTTTHGFFLIMGGFAIEKVVDWEIRICPLDVDDFDDYISAGNIEFPKTTVEEVKDRSKADWLAKAIVLIQTTWYTIQCIARGIDPTTDLTELEVLTLAFASLNGVMYFFWWSKPLDVNRPIVIDLHEIPVFAPSSSQERHVATRPSNSSLSCWSSFGSSLKGVLVAFMQLPKMTYNVIVSTTGERADKNDERVPTFAGPHLDNPTFFTVVVIAGFIGVGFGAMHFVAWNIVVPTSAERLLWRTTTVIVTGTFTLSLFFGLTGLVDDVTIWDWRERCMTGFMYLHVPVIPFYLMSRLLLFALAFASLRDLPPPAYKSIEWTSYIPHFG